MTGQFTEETIRNTHMIEAKTLLKMIRLLFIEARMSNSLGNSIDKVSELLELAKFSIDSADTKVNSLIDIINEMKRHDFEIPMVSEIYRMGLEEAIPDATAMQDLILKIDNVPDLKQEIMGLRAILIKELKVIRIRNRLSSASYKFNREEMTDAEMEEETNSVMEILEKNNPNSGSEKAVTDTLVMSDKQSIKDIFNKIKNDSDPKGVWKTHLTGMNDMLQGGMRDGQLVFVNGTQHSYKSGLSLTTFLSLGLLNEPRPSNKPGIPTLVWLSMEDDMRKVMGDVYGYLKVFDDADFPRVELKDICPDEATEFVTSRLNASSFDFQFYKIDSSDFSFRALFDFLTKLEMEGASLRVVGIDYIANIPKTGCSKTGALGADTRELVRRIRNWMQARNILCISPHQLNTQAKQLIKDGLPGHELVPKVLKNGYTADSSQIDQELDIEIAINPFTYKDRDFLMVGCGKHKLNSVIDDRSKLIFITEFPSNGNKIPPDVKEGQESRCWTKLEDIPDADVDMILL